MITYEESALEYISKLCDGGMRDAITMLDKCLAFSSELTLENVVKAIGATDYDTMFRLTNAIFDHKTEDVFYVIDSIHSSGKDLKLFIRSYFAFMLDVCKYVETNKFDCVQIPSFYSKELDMYKSTDDIGLLKVLLKLNNDIKWDSNPKMLIESTLYLYCLGGLTR